ncbi:MAG: TPM domain-containing protein [Synergistaceae bacterium]|jgi:uncharacterized membrane protein YgcG|nr:TPM domain-containing protein [Synergistaceae bacterium]
MDDVMIPCFKDGKYSEGLLEGVKAVIANITNPAPWWELARRGCEWEVVRAAIAAALLK